MYIKSINWGMSLEDFSQQSAMISVVSGAMQGDSRVAGGARNDYIAWRLTWLWDVFLPEVLNYLKQIKNTSGLEERNEMDLMSKRAELKLSIMDKEADIKETGLYRSLDAIDAGGH